MPAGRKRGGEPPMAQKQGTSAKGGPVKPVGGAEVPVHLEGRLGMSVCVCDGKMELRVHSGPWKCKGDPGFEPRTFLG